MPGRLMWWGWAWETFGAPCVSLLCLLIHSTSVRTRCSHRALLYCHELRRAIFLLHTGCPVLLLGEQGHNTFHPKVNSNAFQGVPWGQDGMSSWTATAKPSPAKRHFRSLPGEFCCSHDCGTQLAVILLSFKASPSVLLSCTGLHAASGQLC